jgi:hypothetical protein
MLKNAYLLYAINVLFVTWHAQAAAGVWQDVTPVRSAVKAVAELGYFQADDLALRSTLLNAPHESSGRLDHQLEIPMPDGRLALFSVLESPIMAPELAAKHPEIKTFKVIGVDDKRVSGRVDITPLGFHAMLDSLDGRIFIDPDDFRLQDHVYRSRFAARESQQNFNCGAHERPTAGTTPVTGLKSAGRIPGSLLQYDLAVAVTLEYHQHFGSEVASTTGAIVTTINRVNFIYERDHGIRLKLVADNEDLYETSESGLLDNADELALLEQLKDWIDNRLSGGPSAYDIGHMFSRPSFFGGGVAYIGVACDDSFKAGGVSGLSNPVRDAFNVDLVAHEIGHQFNAEHSFNGTTGACRVRNRNTAFEPGSGSSVMSYAGICDAENLQNNSDASFHAGSIAQVAAYTAGAGNCYLEIATTLPGNKDPVLSALTDTSIPANTPFVLEGNATDPDLDTLLYRWDQMDAGCPTDAIRFGTDNGSNPLFRSHRPRAEAWRNFPAMGTQLQRRYDKAEVLPCHSRQLDFRLTTTDGRSGQDFEDIRVTVNANAGPFEITNLDPAPTIIAGTAFAVDWNVAGTDLAPINCANVDIDLITFTSGYGLYSIHPLGTAVNDGNALVTINPVNATHPRARVRVKCSDNIFYDLSDADLTIIQSVNPPLALADTDFITRTYANIATTGFSAPACGEFVDCTPPPTKKGGGSSSFDILYLLLMAGMVALRSLRAPLQHSRRIS